MVATAPGFVTFNGAGSSDSDGSITSYAWNFGDGARGIGNPISHTYGTAGIYSAKLTVTDNGGASSSAAMIIVVSPNPDTEPPSQPANLTARPQSASQIALTWNASSDNVGVSKYQVYRNGIRTADVLAGTSYLDYGLTANTTYTYTVTALDAAGNQSPASNPARAKTLRK